MPFIEKDMRLCKELSKEGKIQPSFEASELPKVAHKKIIVIMQISLSVKTGGESGFMESFRKDKKDHEWLSRTVR